MDPAGLQGLQGLAGLAMLQHHFSREKRVDLCSRHDLCDAKNVAALHTGVASQNYCCDAHRCCITAIWLRLPLTLDSKCICYAKSLQQYAILQFCRFSTQEHTLQQPSSCCSYCANRKPKKLLDYFLRNNNVSTAGTSTCRQNVPQD